MEFTKLTRKHGVRIATSFPCSVEECSLAVGKVVGYDRVKSAARMNSAWVIFVDEIGKVNELIESGVVIKDTFVSVLPLTTPAKKVTISNIPPFISDELLIRELSRHGKLVSPIRKLPSGCKSPLLKHVVSHRRQVSMILNNRDVDLSLAFKVKVDDFEYIVFVTSETSKCFVCGGEGHIAKVCPRKTPSDPPSDAGGGEVMGGGGAPGESEPGPSGLQRTSALVESGEQEGEKRASERQNDAEEGDSLSLTVEEPEGEPVIEEEAPGKDSNDKEKDVKQKMVTTPVMTSQQVEVDQVSVESESMDVNEDEEGSECSLSDDESLSQSTQSRRSDVKQYTVEKIQHFLQATKNSKGVEDKVQEVFGNIKCFVASAQSHMRGKSDRLTKQEIFRLRKLVLKLKQKANDDNDDD